MPMAAQTIVDGGAVDYNMGAEGLYNMTEFLLVMMHYVTIIVMGIAVLTALVNAFQIYVKMNNQEGSFPTDSHLRIPRILRYSKVRQYIIRLVKSL